MFLDYDGTLTPIVSDPDAATLSDHMRDAVGKLSDKATVAIVSGRAREKLRNFVQLPELYYAGSHGFDIDGPGGTGAASSLFYAVVSRRWRRGAGAASAASTACVRRDAIAAAARESPPVRRRRESPRPTASTRRHPQVSATPFPARWSPCCGPREIYL